MNILNALFGPRPPALGMMEYQTASEILEEIAYLETEHRWRMLRALVKNEKGHIPWYWKRKPIAKGLRDVGEALEHPGSLPVVAYEQLKEVWDSFLREERGTETERLYACLFAMSYHVLIEMGEIYCES